jgi:hypothetical protein
MFDRMFQRGPAPVEPVVDTDPARDDLDLRDAREKARGGDWGAARAVIDAAGRDWELRGQRIGVLSMIADDAWIRAWQEAVPNDPAAALIHASWLFDKAADARGSASAAHTSSEQFENFARLSKEAAAAGQRAIALAPEDPAPWSQLIGTMFADGRQRKDEFAMVFAEGRRRDPFNFDLHVKAVSFLCEKWYGSHEEMFHVARGASAAAPPGSGAVMLPVFAHLEYAMREYSWEKRTDEARDAVRRFLGREDIRRELDACVAKWRASGPRRLGSTMACYNWLALAYTLAGRRDEARAAFDQIGPYLGSAPTWGYFYRRRSEGFLAGWRWAHGVKPTSAA